ncbi:MAG: O-methyltransferase [Lachnospiraceae bacterium]|nr:O-methyltransferase [Lachnospiraceae bacterium]
MEAENRMEGYLRSLSGSLPERLRRMEAEALAEYVPIIRRQTQEFLRFLLRMKRPERILELGTAVGFSGNFIAEYMPENAELLTVEKVPMRIVKAKVNLASSPHANRIRMLTGDALQVLRALNGKEPESSIGIYYPGGKPGTAEAQEPFRGYPMQNDQPDGWLDDIYEWNASGKEDAFDLIFLDAAKAQYMSYLPEILELMRPDSILVTDNILQEGSVADSKFSIPRRDRTIHMRMREYLYEITHCAALDTVLLKEGDGIALSRRR